MAKILSTKIIFNSLDVIENAKRTCPVCEVVNKEFSGMTTGRHASDFYYITTHACECNSCGSKWVVNTNEGNE